MCKSYWPKQEICESHQHSCLFKIISVILRTETLGKPADTKSPGVHQDENGLIDGLNNLISSSNKLNNLVSLNFSLPSKVEHCPRHFQTGVFQKDEILRPVIGSSYPNASSYHCPYFLGNKACITLYKMTANDLMG